MTGLWRALVCAVLRRCEAFPGDDFTAALAQHAEAARRERERTAAVRLDLLTDPLLPRHQRGAR